MNLTASYDEEDKDIIHFRGQFSKGIKAKRLCFSTHIDDLSIAVDAKELAELLRRLENEVSVPCQMSLGLLLDEDWR
jgi:hypothetical protein